MQVRLERPDDRDAVRELQLRAFGDHGGVVARFPHIREGFQLPHLRVQA
ncbi:MAG: hypothetical protein M0027_03235 [Candidatus Dormibacteraeota bacterium]|nr:hypothetical protein [Candidatus Dormibacteraeota bacterium]